MSDSETNSVDRASPPATMVMDDLVQRLQERVAQRRASGELPADLEDDLDAHFRRIVHHRSLVDISHHLDEALSVMERASHIDRTPLSNESERAGGAMLHKAVNKALARHVENIFDKMQDFADAVQRELTILNNAVQDPSTHVHSDLVGQIDSIIERLESYERSPVDSGAALGDLRRRVEILEAAAAKPTSEGQSTTA